MPKFEALNAAPNSPELHRQIREAAILITAQYRAIGRKLHPSLPDVPTLDEVEERLRGLVDGAVAAYNATVDVVPPAAEQITGNEEDDLFEAFVTHEEVGDGLHLELYQQLV